MSPPYPPLRALIPGGNSAAAIWTRENTPQAFLACREVAATSKATSAPGLVRKASGEASERVLERNAG
jgi:hypothetical protein